MKTQQIIAELRRKNEMSQDEFAAKLFVTRQAVSRWENGETVPNTDTLKLMSKVFGVSINTILGQPRNTICQVCGMPLDDEGNYSKETDGSINDKYCKWCYVDGVHAYTNMEDVISEVIKHQNWGTPEQMQEFLRKQLAGLEYWQK
ncbi:MAG: helix-turn-helix domain-containing protein [Oscillospiraceae bacterium]|jgi:transcriptional regulator with XRE-family HTH domain|nr:helix-turn-helix domain-containing protein [Oscillospiraceae bacterium]